MALNVTIAQVFTASPCGKTRLHWLLARACDTLQLSKIAIRCTSWSNRIPEPDLIAARRFLEYLLVSPAFRAAQAAPVDDEEVTSEDAEAMGREESAIAAGRVSEHEDVLREFGLR